MRWGTIVLFLSLKVCAFSLLAQNATVTGSVSDTADARIPGATVRIRNIETNSTREMKASQEGDFTLTNLAPGRYEITAEHEGFRSYKKTDIVLELGMVFRDDIKLQIGSVTESVSVTAEAALINTEVGSIKGDVIVQQEINDMPLDGRDFTDLAFMVPGVIPMAQGGQGSGLNVNGARSDSTNYSVDGFNNRNPRGAAAQVRPNMGAMQEFKMEVSGYSAESGRMAGGVINMVLRSGTNQFHGDLFEYVRNSVFDARSFFDTQKLPLRRNQYGATAHGPVYIPKIYNGRDRTFFMFSWEAYREVLGQSSIGRVPTALERNGDFSRSPAPDGSGNLFLRDPLATGNCNASSSAACFPGKIVPRSRFHPTALKLLDYFPLPNRSDVGNNYIATAKDFDLWNSYMTKIDHRFNSANSVAFRYQLRKADTTAPFGGSELPYWPNYVNDDRSLAGIDYTHMFSPTLLTEVRGGFSRNATVEREHYQGQNIAEQFGLPSFTTDPLLLGFPRFVVLDHMVIGSAAAQPAHYHVTTLQASNKYTWIRSKHVFKWGFDVERVRFNQPFLNNVRGTFNFNRNNTNHQVADTLLGFLQSTTRTAETTRNYMRSFSLGSFFNDDWKITRSLTLNLGLRYELDLPPVDRYDRASNFVPGINKIVIADDRNLPGIHERIAAANLQNRITFADEVGLPRALVYSDPVNFAPRLGFAWRLPTQKTTVVRGGYGIFYTGHLLNPVRTSLMTGFPFSVNLTFNRLAADPLALSLSNPFNQSRQAAENGTASSNGYELRPNLGYLQSWNFTIERELGGGAALEIGYVGSKGTHLGRQYDVNLPRRSLALYQANSSFPRPISGINAIQYYSFGSNSHYHSGQISLRRRTRGLFYRVNYSFSKSIDDASQLTGASAGGFTGAQNPDDLRSERARSDFDRRHVVTGVFSMPVPLGKGKRFFSGASGWRNGIIGGWQLSGSATYYSGQALTVLTSGIDANVGETSRPNRIGSGLQADIPGAGRRGIDYPWFNLKDFERVPRCASRTDCSPSPSGFTPFGFGNSGRNILDGPAQHFINLALLKNFRMEHNRNVQVRYELFNIMNHANFQLPDRNFNSLSGGLITSVNDRGRGGPRVMQLALKFEW